MVIWTKNGSVRGQAQNQEVAGEIGVDLLKGDASILLLALPRPAPLIAPLDPPLLPGRVPDLNRQRRKREEIEAIQASENSEEAEERRKLKKIIRENEHAYKRPLKNWEKREREQAKKYERYERKTKDRKVNILKEAKRMRHFLEDYDDENDDAKCYKASVLFKRRREFEREREADQKDSRARETRGRSQASSLKEEATVEVQIHINHLDSRVAKIAPLEVVKVMMNLRQTQLPRKSQSLFWSEAGYTALSSNAGTRPPVQVQWKSVDAPAPSNAVPASGSSSALSFHPKKDLSQRLNGVFGVEEDEHGNPKSKMKPFEITREERMAKMSEEEKKKLQKDLIGRIPTSKDDLFAFEIYWKFVDESLLNGRVRPWVGTKITEYIGEEEKALVDFIVEKIHSKTLPSTI